MASKLTNFLSSKTFMVVVSLFGLYLLSTGSSWALFSYLVEDPGFATDKEIEKARSKIGDGLPKTETCPINGKMYSVPEREIWENRRPLTAMIENHLDARPLSGVSKADVVYEAVAEGGITRFMAVYYCGAASEDFDVAVIRSARVYYINWAAEYGDRPLFLHWGGANNICNNCPGGVKLRGQIDPRVDAFKLLNQIGWRNGQYGNDLDGQSNFGYPALVRVQDRLNKGERTPDEHTPTTHMDELYKQVEKRGYTNVDTKGKEWDASFREWKFTDEKPAASPAAGEISFDFWSNKSDYSVKWVYDKASNTYLRQNGGVAFTDYHFDNEQIASKNVLIQFVREEGPVDQEGHMYYKVTGTGDGLLFQNGDVVEITWEKDDLTSRTIFYGEDGKEVTFVRGEIWIEAVPNGNKINY